MAIPPEESAWAGTLSGADVEVQRPAAADITTPPQSKGWEGECPNSPDTCHWYDRSTVAPQSQERFECRFCDDFHWD
jgi:hypothetical protein